MIAALIERSLHKKRRKTDSCALCHENVWHKVFITSPPGWGTVVDCRNGKAKRDGILVRSEADISRLRWGRA